MKASFLLRTLIASTIALHIPEATRTTCHIQYSQSIISNCCMTHLTPFFRLRTHLRIQLSVFRSRSPHQSETRDLMIFIQAPIFAALDPWVTSGITQLHSSSNLWVASFLFRIRPLTISSSILLMEELVQRHQYESAEDFSQSPKAVTDAS